MVQRIRVEADTIRVFILCFRCCCGRPAHWHGDDIDEVASSNENWLPGLHTVHAPTDAFGTIEFQGTNHPTKAQVKWTLDENGKKKGHDLLHVFIETKIR